MEDQIDQLLTAIEAGHELHPIIQKHGFCSQLQQKIGSHLGSGGFGDVYDYLDGKNIAIKVSRAPLTDSELVCVMDGNFSCISDAVNEALVGACLTKLQLPYFTKFHAMFVCDSKLFIAMEKVAGVPVNRVPNLTDEDKVYILIQITYALHIAQKKLFFNHNDLISDNILLTPNSNYVAGSYEVFQPEPSLNFRVPVGRYNVKIIDYGLSRVTYKGRHISPRRVATKYYLKSESQGRYVPFSSSVDFCRFMNNRFLATPSIDKSILAMCEFTPSYQPIPSRFTGKYPCFGSLDILMTAFKSYRI